MLDKDYSHNRVKEARIVDDLYRLWIKTLPCAVRGCNRLDVDAHHPISTEWDEEADEPRFKSRFQFGKAHDKKCQPLCRGHHAELHDKIGDERKFENKYGLDFKKNVIILNKLYSIGDSFLL